MQLIYAIVVYGMLFVGAFFLADAIVGFMRTARGKDDDAVERRLSNSIAGQVQSAPQYDLLRKKDGAEAWGRYIPFLPRLSRLVQSSGTGISTERALGLMLLSALLAFIPLTFLLPARFLLISFLL